MGVLDSVDQYLNIKLLNVSVVESDKFPQLMNMKNCFIRGSSIRYVQIPAGEVDTDLEQVQADIHSIFKTSTSSRIPVHEMIAHGDANVAIANIGTQHVKMLMSWE
ncbi:u6 snrna-associated sm-like protein lsm2 [Plasmopara halstedii]|uniref:U6 snrna-associated sm-like protein lsm2 n=1 Tax=Plasmopara halstedii TaxID=4781 RepID=A0A0N7L6X5_PLAHL|nr:u6 snrna-associated sm-like protein lsm2 [Plasmopara halstedii]CEG45491.1 u6 snrna-associated sm-like protein lsm2 [Plasmopara halstedii]|eukprot:XP_024581860.1 u6 snrna-associated sm-like protein lsm2 [Plasmopara halstedii]